MIHLTRAARSLALAALIGLPVAGGAAGESLSGAYLAGINAMKRGDVDGAAEYMDRALARDPGNAQLTEQAMLYLAAAGRIEKAISLAEAVIVSDPDHQIASLLLVAKDMQAGKFAAARSRIKDHPKGFHPLIGGLIAAWADQGDGKSPESAFQGLDDRPIFRVFKLYHSGLMRHARGDLEGAITAWSELATDLALPTGRVARAYAAALIEDGKPEEAREVYKNAQGVAISDGYLKAGIEALDSGAPAPGPLVKTPQEGMAETLFGLAAALGSDGDPRLSLLYTRVASWLRPDLFEAILLSAELLDEGEQNAAAVHAYESIPSDNPLGRAAEIGRAEALFRLERKDEAAEALKALARRDPEAVDVQVALGDMMRRVERFSEAAKAYDAAVTLMEEAGKPSWVLHYQRGIAYEQSNQWEKAEADFQKALELQPNQPLVLNYLGYSWLVKDRNVEEAMEMIRLAVDQRPEDGFIIDSLGWGYYLLGDYESAIPQLEKAVELEPIDPILNDHFGDALWMVGRHLEAEFQWRRALSFEPKEEDAARIRAKLDRGLDAVLEEEAAKTGPVPATSTDGG